MDQTKRISEEERALLKANATRQRALERASKLLDPKKRRFGLDLETIQAQIEEKKQLKEQEKLKNLSYDQMVLEQQELVLDYMEKENQMKKQIAKEEEEYRKNYQKPEQSREYDIWRKDLKKISQPVRIGDNDKNLGISSGQIFSGEDLESFERLDEQAKQRLQWYKEHKIAKSKQEQKEEVLKLKSELYELETQKVLIELQKQNELIKKDTQKQLYEDNLKLMEEKKNKEKYEKELELKFN